MSATARTSISISDVRFTSADPRQARRGLVGWISATVNGSFRLDGLTLRRTRAGKLVLSFPCRRGGFRPLDDTARRALEQQVLKAIREDVA